MKKKALSLLLALAMCLSLLPTAALAEEAQMPEQEPAPIPAQEEEQDAPEDPKEKYGIGLFSVEDGHDDSHPICGASCSDSAHMLPAGKTWQPIKTASELRNAAGGYYYLANDISLAGSTGITAWSPKDGVVLCLNGKSITVENGQQPTINVGVLDSSAPINFTLTDCHARSEQGKITRAASGVGPGVQVLPNSIFTMYGGSLVDNGCGVSLTGGTFNMYGGTISNSAVYGGVRATYSMNNQTNAYAGGIFNMYDGSITGNTSNYGGGVFVDSDSSRSVAAAFYMYGGSIMGNSANTLGYGTGGGVYVNAGATFEVSGDVTITGNTKDGAKNNVYLPNGAAMTVGALDADASIGVTMAERATVTGVTSGSISNLTSDDDQYTFELDSKGNLVQKEKPAAHAHYLCGGSTCTGAGHTKEESTTTFTEWKSADSLPTEAGSYYLTTNVTLKQSWNPTENITLCLNGKTITAEDSFDAVQVAAGRSFTLTDCHTGEAQGTITHDENKTGRGVYVAGGTFHLYGGAISGKKVAGNGGGVCVGATGAFTMCGGMISVNTATYNSREWSGGNGGGVCVGANGAFTMYGGTISGNKATYNSRASSATGSGGGVCMLWGNDDDPGTFTMSGGSITKNEALNGGGLYAAAKSTFTMSGSSAISENTAASDDDDGHGGGVYMRGSFTMSGSSTISGNKATNDGAGVFVAGSYNETAGASFIMNSGTVSNNEVTSSSGSGGGVFVGGNNIKNGSFTLNDGTISGNKASYGGGVAAYGDFDMNDGTISGNEASYGGGGVYSVSYLTMEGGTISGNTAAHRGGGVYASSNFTMSGGTISGNTATGDSTIEEGGGGVYASSNFTMNNGTISGNMTSRDGGGVYAASEFSMYGGTISGNSAGTHPNSGGHGGGVCFASSTMGYNHLYLCGGTITGNNVGKSYSSGGGVWVNSSYAHVSGSVQITGNVQGGTKAAGATVYTGGTASNFYNDNGYDVSPLEINTYLGGLKSDSQIGISVAENHLPYPGENPVTVVTGAAEGDLEHFFADAGEPYVLEYRETTDAETGSTIGTIALTYPVTHTHYLCGGDDCTEVGGHTESAQTTFTKWTATDSLPDAAGNYYLTGNVTLTSTWTPKNGTVLDLNGFSITMDKTGPTDTTLRSVIYFTSSTFTLVDCKGENTEYGKITHAADVLGKGVQVGNGGTFNMYGGHITGNSATGSNGVGGGVTSYGPFNLYNGTISGNTASNRGAGVFIGSNGSFAMYGGTISNNTANERGGGAFVYGSNLTISGAAVITGNMGANGVPDNAYLSSGKTVTVAGALSTDCNVGVTMEKPTLGMTVATASGVTLTEVDAAKFSSDNSDYRIALGTKNALVLAKAAPTPVVAPTAKTNLTYNGQVQTGVASGEGYTLSGTVTATDAGTYEATATLDSGYVWSDNSTEPKTISWSIGKKVPTASDFNITIPADSTYDGTVRQLNISLKEGLTGCDYKVVVSTGGQVTSEIKNAGLYLFRIEITEGGNFKAETLRDSDWSFTIEKARFNITAAGYTGVYDGQPHSITVTVNNNPGAVIRYNTQDSAVSGSYEEWGYDSLSYTDAGEYTVYYRVSAANYAYTGGSATITISKAEPTLPAGLTGTKGRTLSSVALPEGWTWADPTAVMTAVGEQHFPADYAGTKNYSAKNGVSLTVTVTDKADAKVTFAEAVPGVKTYGDADFTLVAVAGAQSTNAAWAWTSSDETVLQATGSGASATVKILKASETPVTITAKYESDGTLGQAAASITVNRATVTVTAAGKSAFVGDPVPALPAQPVLGTDYTVTGLVNGDTLGGTVVLAYASEPDMTKPGTTAITVSGVTVSENYILRTAEGTLTVSAKSSPSGGITPVASYPVNLPETVENGSISSSGKRASKGSTVTITVTPDSGFVLDDLTVTDKDGNTLPLTDKGDGKYSFVMPAGPVDIRAAFAPEAETSPFTDVSPRDYYYEAVCWAAENEITGGVGGGLFAPDLTCTRAQIVTLLWRAAGSPEPQSTASFTDVAPDAYYAKAVSWAVEKGITTGTGDGKFSPDAPCTRAQAVTFLFRAAKAEASGAPDFRDVAADAYYAAAVKWATDNGITQGVGDGLFAPDQLCTRSQIVTFLWRVYHK
ncbi:MAG: S-layer homology domain-containing protein [Clostridia bacterium]|nr:S-layer homology domain-containing protein [Clostridia bacterium]